MGNQPFGIAGAERAAATQQEDGFEQGGLARTIGADDEIAPGMQVQFGLPQAAQVLNRQLTQAHAHCSTWNTWTRTPYSRIGITTYLVSVESGSANQAAAVGVGEADLDRLAVQRARAHPAGNSR